MAQSAPSHGPASPVSQDLKQRATDQFERMAERASDQFRNIADQAEHMANRAGEQGRAAGQRMQEVAGNFKGAVDKSVKEQPTMTLVMAAAVGFVLGALWKS
jgi:ElaB/YqjD/DUF883 family membrane-anchored ribosome-binding protein